MKYKHTKRAVIAATVAVMAGGGVLAGVAAAATPSITTVAGNGKPVSSTGSTGSLGDGGPAVNAQLSNPTGVAEDLATSLYIGDTGDNKVRKVVFPTTINKDIISTIAGTGVRGYSGDGGLATSAKLNAPSGVAVDAKGDVFFADTGNDVVREINASGIITTVAGMGSCNINMNNNEIGNNGPATGAMLCLSAPTGIALDSSGDLFISDTGHNQVRERVASTGKIQVFAGKGSPGSSGDGGPATKALLNTPTGLVIDSVGNVYIGDTGNNKVRVVGTSGNISTFAGTGKAGFSGDGGAPTSAKLNGPTGLGVDPSGNLFISDTANQRIREVMSGTISTYAGNGTAGFSGDGGPANLAELHTPTGQVASDGSAVYFDDTANLRIRGVFVGPPPVLGQSFLVILLPISGALVIGAGIFFVTRRRRRATTAVAS